MSYTTIAYKTWNDFKKDYCEDLYGGTFEMGKYLFRGQANADWDLVTSFDRIYSHIANAGKKKKIEEELINTFCTDCERHIQNNRHFSQMPMMEKTSMAQHYGVPTRLLDWSYSPFIAAYFAFSTVDFNHPPHNIAIWALLKEHDIWKDKGVEITEDITHENDHQKRQLGCFTMLNNQTKSINKFVESCDNNGEDVSGALTQIIIPASEFKPALQELEAMNINASTIYGGFEGCARAACDLVARKYI